MAQQHWFLSAVSHGGDGPPWTPRPQTLPLALCHASSSSEHCRAGMEPSTDSRSAAQPRVRCGQGVELSPVVQNQICSKFS